MLHKEECTAGTGRGWTDASKELSESLLYLRDPMTQTKGEGEHICKYNQPKTEFYIIHVVPHG